MTALNFYLEENQVCIALDTLSLSAEDRKPLAFVSKFAVLPHLQSIVTGTGHGMLIQEWLATARANVVARDVEQLNEYTPDYLRNISTKYPELTYITATVYHFGYSIAQDKFTGYAYRSTSDWNSEELVPGIGIKPPVKYSIPEDFQLPQTFVDIMKQQQVADSLLPLNERVGIGGDIHFIVLSRSGTHVSQCYRFDSYEEDYTEMCERL